MPETSLIEARLVKLLLASVPKEERCHTVRGMAQILNNHIDDRIVIKAANKKGKTKAYRA